MRRLSLLSRRSVVHAFGVKPWVVVVSLAAIVAGTALGASSDNPRLSQIYLNGMQGGTGGTYGYYVKQVGGSIAGNVNDGYVYDPASALKTLLLVYVERQVGSGADVLTSPVAVYTYPGSRNANGNPASPDLCPDPADETPANAVTPSPTLQVVLSGMMVDSNNRYARAIELRYGRGNLNAFAASLGLTNTHLNQIFGCANDGGQYNTWTLDDAGKLYEAVANGSSMTTNARASLYNTMISTGYATSSPFVQSVVRPEADALGIDDAVSQFANDMVAHFKGGSYDICYGSCATNDVISRDEAGILTVPFKTSSGTVPTDYVWGSFIANLQGHCPTFPCAAGDQANTAVVAAMPEMFRDTIRAALTSWAALTTLVADRAAPAGNGLRFTAHLSTVYGNKRPSGQTITFTAKAHTLCTARTDMTGTATCTTAAGPPDASQYTAAFAGGDGLFAASATAPIELRSVRLSIKKSGKGTITSSPAGITCGTHCSANFAVGIVVKLTAKPAKGYAARWSGACAATKRLTCTLRINRSTVVAIVFARAKTKS